MLSPENTRRLFESGNYVSVASKGDPEQWQTYAAMGLIGGTERALTGLERQAHPEAGFYRGVALWIAGDEQAALKELETVSTDHARRLVTLIRKPRIRALTQLTWLRHSPHDLVTAIEKDEKFSVQNVSFYPPDHPNAPYADARTWYSPDAPPDFYICGMLEWHIKPPNLQALPCPIFGHTSDIDVHVQCVHPWFHVFDELLTVGAEWNDLRRVVDRPVSAFPRVYGIAGNIPPLAEQERDIDVFISGTTLHPYHPDKAKLYHQVIGMTDARLRIVNGFMTPDKYFALLNRSRVVFTYYRRDEAPLTRALEALAMGCVVVTQRGNTLGFYTGEENGLQYYDVDRDNLVPVIRQTLERWAELAPGARQGALAVRREFAMPRLASQYFRFLTFLAGKPRARRIHYPVEKLDQRRLVLWKGLLPADAPDLQKIREKNIAVWQERPEMHTSPHVINNIARELMLEYAAIDTNFQRMQNAINCEKLLSRILEIYMNGIRRFPRSLALRFNMIRAALLFGQPNEVRQALELGHETLEQPSTFWKIDVNEDVLPWDFCETYFNYRGYLDAIVEHLVTRRPVVHELQRMIRASIAFYLGHYDPDTRLFEMASRLDPDFPFYTFGYARRLAQRGQPESDRQAGDMLVGLIERSVVAFDAYELLQNLKTEGRYRRPDLEAIEQKMTHAIKSSSMIERQPYVLPLKPAWWARPRRQDNKERETAEATPAPAMRNVG